jgi:pilus assembly protein CpaE
MPPGLPHRVVLVAVEPALEPALRAALARRSVGVAASCADAEAARAEALAGPGAAHLFIAQLDARRLAALTAALPGQPVVALLPPGAGVAEILEAQRSGAAQVVPLPLRGDDLLEALDGVALLFGPAESEARVIAVCGVSGGCGATTLALNLADQLGRLAPGALPPAQPRLLVELSRQMGALATYLDVEPPLTTLDLLTDPAKLTAAGVRRALATVAPGLDVLVGPYQDVRPHEIWPRQVHQLVAACRRLASAVVLDVPCSFDDLQFETLSLADQVVLVGVQTVASVRTLKLIRDALEREEGIVSMRLVINRYEPSLPGFDSRRLAELLGVPVLTVANDYPSVMAAVNQGKVLSTAAPHSPVLADVRALARALTGATGPAPSPQGDRLARALGRREPAPPRIVRVLHVEDDAVTQQAMRLHLSAIKEFTFAVTTAASESEAAEAFARQPFDVVLLDYHLAQGNGLSCLRQLRALDPMVPVVVISSVVQPQVAADLLAAGADDFLSKENVSGQTLVRSLSAAVARAEALEQRLGDDNRLDTFLDRVRRALGDEGELLRGLHEIQQHAAARRYSAGQIQRLADLVCGELDRAAPPGQATPRKALLALFMRVFGGQGGA